MIRKTAKWAYVTCIRCARVRYMTHDRLQKKLSQGLTEDEFELTFKCRTCKGLER